MNGNVEAVRRLFDATTHYLQGQSDSLHSVVSEVCAPTVMAAPSSALASGDVGPFYGQDAVVDQFAAIAALWQEFEIVADDYVEVPPNTVVLLGKVRAKRGDGSGYAMELGIVNRFEDGLIASIHSYESKRRALEEAGGPQLPPGRRSKHQP